MGNTLFNVSLSQQKLINSLELDNIKIECPPFCLCLSVYCIYGSYKTHVIPTWNYWALILTEGTIFHATNSKKGDKYSDELHPVWFLLTGYLEEITRSRNIKGQTLLVLKFSTATVVRHLTAVQIWCFSTELSITPL